MDKKPHRATGRPRGRPRKYPLPTLAEASLNPSPAAFDARAILRSIAADAALPAQARVAAAKALLVDEKPAGDPVKARAGKISERALQLMAENAPDIDEARPN